MQIYKTKVQVLVEKWSRLICFHRILTSALQHFQLGRPLTKFLVITFIYIIILMICIADNNIFIIQ